MIKKKFQYFNLKIGDKVLVQSERHKLECVYDSPFEILEFDNNNVTIIDRATNKKKKLHRNRIIEFNNKYKKKQANCNHLVKIKEGK